jgi:ribosome-binding factor A
MTRIKRGRGRDQGGQARYPRVARVNELCREILADELERIDDERLELVTIINVDVDPDLRRARVDFSSLGEAEEEAAEALEEHRHRLQSAIARQARLRNTPELRFSVDTVIAYAARIETLLAEAPPIRPDADDADAGPDADADA